MGWKQIKEHFDIDGLVHVFHMTNGQRFVMVETTPDPFHIPVVICMTTGDLAGTEKAIENARTRYPALMASTKQDRLNLLTSIDQFSVSQQVFMVVDESIVGMSCEAHGYPNVTHCGRLMYFGTFFPSLELAVECLRDRWQAQIDALELDVAKMAEIQTKRFHELQRRIRALRMQAVPD